MNGRWQKILDSLGFARIGRILNSKRISILMYHRFCVAPQPFKVEQRVFDEQLGYLKRYYTILSLDDLCHRITNGISLPRNSVILTIDDGYADCYYYAFPLLKKYNIPATIFLTTDFIDKRRWLWANEIEYILKRSKRKQFVLKLADKETHFDVSSFSGWHEAQLSIFDYCRRVSDQLKNDFIEMLSGILKVSVPEEIPEEFAPLSWDQIREMCGSGINIGSHTRTHAILSRLDKVKAEKEIGESKRAIEDKLSKKVLSFCYPNGSEDDFTDESISIIKARGYQCAVTSMGGMNEIGEDLFRLKRIGLFGGQFSYFKRKVAFGS